MLQYLKKWINKLLQTVHNNFACVVTSYIVYNNNDRLTAFDPGQPG